MSLVLFRLNCETDGKRDKDDTAKLSCKGYRIMLMHGMPESVIKQISGHAGDSHSFIRYVSLVQPYLDAQIDRHFERMQQQ